MVLTRRVGKTRPFWRGFLLTVVTLGVYGYYWMYKAHDEVFKQYELDREGRDEGLGWLVVGRSIPIVLLVYWWKLAENVGYVRARMRLPARMTPGKFVGMHVGAMLALFIGTLVALALLTVSGPGDAPSDADPARPGAGEDVTFEPFLTVYAVSGVLALALLSIAYHGMQRDVNETWAWYDAHMEPRFRATAPGPGPDLDAVFDPPV